MDNYSKHYIRIDSDKNIICGFSDAFEQPQTADICINEQGGRQFELLGEVNPGLINQDGVYLFKYSKNKVVRKTEAEVQAESNPLEKAIEQKLEEINTACQRTIYAGIEIETSKGVKRFSLEEHDQTELMGLMADVKDGKLAEVPYHANGEICELWSLEDFSNIAKAAMGHIFYNRTYCNHLKQAVKRLEAAEAVQAVTYGAPLPDDLLAHMMGLIAAVSENA